jgi:uncharacterized protein YndB with AHSA1/START domain
LIDRSIKYPRKGESPMRLLALALVLLATPAAAQTVAEADGSRTLVNEAFVPAPPETVWQAVTTAEGWKRWAVPAAWFSPTDPDLIETAYDPSAKPGDPNTIQQRFLARLPRRLLVFRTVKTPAGFPHAQAFMRVTQFMELLPEAGGTRVRLTGTGYPAGAEGDELLAFFEVGNRETLGHMAQRLALTPLDFLAGHCWRGTLPNGDADTHCFKQVENALRDHHEVVRAGKTVYSGETIYAWAEGAIHWTYASIDGGTMKGVVKASRKVLDFGTADYVGADGSKLTIATRWARDGEDAYMALDQGATHNRATRYKRVD